LKKLASLILKGTLMREFDYVMVACLVFILGEAALIITVNTKRDYWKLINKVHLLSVVFYPIYLGSVIYTSQFCNHSHENHSHDMWCELLWKVCSMLYITLTIIVWSFYYVKRKIAETILWDWKQQFERVAMVVMAVMGILGFVFFIIPIKGLHYNSFSEHGKCHRAIRSWIPALWMFGDIVVSALLLVLFIRPLQEITKLMSASPRSVSILISIRRLIKKNRNLLLLNLVFTLGAMVIVSAIDLCMRSVHNLWGIERLLTLQCITLTFNYEPQEYLYENLNCLCCCECDKPRLDEELSSSEMISGSNRKRTSIIIIKHGPTPFRPSKPKYETEMCLENRKSGSSQFTFGDTE